MNSGSGRRSLTRQRPPFTRWNYAERQVGPGPTLRTTILRWQNFNDQQDMALFDGREAAHLECAVSSVVFNKVLRLPYERKARSPFARRHAGYVPPGCR